jgi:hypothetical protein
LSVLPFDSFIMPLSSGKDKYGLLIAELPKEAPMFML